MKRRTEYRLEFLAQFERFWDWHYSGLITHIAYTRAGAEALLLSARDMNPGVCFRLRAVRVS